MNFKYLLLAAALLVACGDGRCVELLEVQLAGKKRMDAAAFLNGSGLQKDMRFESPKQ